MSEYIKVSDDLSIKVWSSGSGLDITSNFGDEDKVLEVYDTELPALLARLNAAAEAMGIATELQRLRFENKQRQDFIEELILTLHPKAAAIFRQRLADMLAAEQ